MISCARLLQLRTGGWSVPEAALPSDVSLAVSQQALAYGAVLLGENIYTRIRLSPDDPGRPNLTSLAISIGGYGGTIALLSVKNDFTHIAGLLLGIATSLQVLTACVNRATNTKSDPDTWPGPKSWPIVMSLGASSVALAFIQSFPSLGN